MDKHKHDKRCLKEHEPSLSKIQQFSEGVHDSFSSHLGDMASSIFIYSLQIQSVPFIDKKV